MRRIMMFANDKDSFSREISIKLDEAGVEFRVVPTFGHVSILVDGWLAQSRSEVSYVVESLVQERKSA